MQSVDYHSVIVMGAAFFWQANNKVHHFITNQQVAKHKTVITFARICDGAVYGNRFVITYAHGPLELYTKYYVLNESASRIKSNRR